MNIQDKTKEELINELSVLQQEISSLKTLKGKRADELVIAKEEKGKRANELVIAKEEKGKRANELVIAKEEKGKRADELVIANKELVFQNEEKEKRAGELVIANKELAYQNELKEKRAAELITANKELVFQNREKEKRADELIMANKELAFQNKEKEKRAAELVIANKELAFQNKEKEKRAAELIIANKELAYQNELKEKRAAELVITIKELQQLIQLNKDKNKFFSIITHDLKSPFNSIVGFSELLMEQIKEKNYEKIGEFANIILQSSNRAMDLLLNLMVWAQSQSGRMDVNPEYFDIVTLIDEVTLILNDIAEQKSIHIASTLTPSIQVNADKEMINTVMRNLISNAIKFTQPEGKITISAVDKQNELTVSVSDTGVGISKDRIEMLFNISDGYSTPGTQKEIGTGLGLILCKEFINKNNGKIWVESETGIGTTFYFSLPLNLENKQNVDMLKK